MMQRSRIHHPLLPLAAACAGLAVLAAIVLAAPGAESRPLPRTAGVNPEVYASLGASPDGQATFILLMDDRADLSGAGKIADWGERGRYVYESLRRTAERSQAPLLAARQAAAIPGRISEFEPLWIVNAVVVHGDRRALDALARQPGVGRVLPEAKMAPLSASFDSAPDGHSAQDASHRSITASTPEAPATVCDPAINVWGVLRIGASTVWGAPYNVTGQGIVIGVVDTGVVWDHPALKGQYRGWNAATGTVDHNYNWYNPAGLCDDSATGTCDADYPFGPPYPDGHGTHVTGIAAGWDGGTAHIGVAPGARWIHAVACTTYACPLAATLASLQWMLAPTDLTGADPDPANRPHVVNNSWGSEGFGGSLIFDDAIASLAAAGIVPVFAAGNMGNNPPYGLGCASLDSPGDTPSAFNVGSTTSSDAISSWSSRGPNPFMGATGPHVVAPGGGGICSAEATGGYGYGSGTSMAAPHVAGAAALLLSAAPALIGQVDQVEEILRRTAVPLTTGETCGGVPGTQVPNNTYGWGRIDVQAAVEMVWQAGTLSGIVTGVETGLPIAGVTMSITRNGYTLTQATDATGHYSFVAGAGTYQVKAEAFGYVAQMASSVGVSQDTTTTQDFELGRLAAGSIAGTVLESGDPAKPVQGAVLELLPVSVGISTTTAADGTYSLTDVPIGAQTVRLRAPGYETLTQNVDVIGAMAQNFGPAPVVDYATGDGGDTCSVEYNWIDAADGTDIAAGLGDDDAVSVALPAPFAFYGASYTTVSVASNGLLSFGQGYWNLNDVIPFAGAPNNAIYAFADDLNPANGAQGNVYAKTLADSRLVIEYSQVQHTPNGDPETFEVVLDPADGSILVQYRAVSLANNALVGVENADGSRGLRYSYAGQPPVTPGLAVKLMPFSGRPPVCARAVAPLLEITRDGSDAVLRWQHVTPDQGYEIWRDVAPYFDPPQGTWLDTVAAVPGIITYPDAGGIGDPLINHFYLVRGRVAGVPSGPSNRVGEFDFALETGN